MYTYLLEPKLTTNKTEFVGYWKNFYDEAYVGKYEEVIGKPVWDHDDIHLLFEWKNNMGTKLSGSKEKFVKKITDNLPLVHELRKSFDQDRFNTEFGKQGAVWSITFLHALQPDIFPIYDQHAHRAFKFLTTGKVEAMPPAHRIKLVYNMEYRPFFQKFSSEVTSLYTTKEVDEALWSFGRFIKLYPRMCYE
jgi:hypothetical protein